METPTRYPSTGIRHARRLLELVVLGIRYVA
jgi:hypothetical protein